MCLLLAVHVIFVSLQNSNFCSSHFDHPKEQITKFSCGAISLGFGGSHALFDRFGAFNFLASWTHISRGIGDKSTHGYDQQLIIPNHSRQKLFNAINNTSSISSTSDATNISSSKSAASSSIYQQDHVMAIQDLYGIPMQAMASDDRSWASELAKFGKIESQGFKLVTLCMKKETVETWKEFAVESGKLSKCSTMSGRNEFPAYGRTCTYIAMIWFPVSFKCCIDNARVKALSLEPNTNICLQFPVDSRRGLQPPLGNNFMGNAFILASVSCSAKDLCAEPLHNTIRRIQLAKDLITNEYIKLYVQALECSSDKFFPSMRELTIITDWLKFPFDALDFGWGKVSSASLLGTPVPEAVFLMPSLEEPGNFLVRIGMGEQHVSDFISTFNTFEDQ